MNLVQKDLDRIKAEWNCHRISESRQSCCPSGHSNELYQLPQLLGTYYSIDWSPLPSCKYSLPSIGITDYSHPVDPMDMGVAKEYRGARSTW